MATSNTLVRTLGAAGLALMALAGPATAEEERKFSYYWTVTGASEYMFRGISYTDGDPTINSYVEATWGKAYLAFWTSNIDDHFKVYGPWEQDIYLGVRPVTGPISWDLAVWYYLYGAKGNFDMDDLDYFEFKIGASATPITNLTVGLTGYYTPEQENEVQGVAGFATQETGTIEGSLAYTLPAWRNFTPTVSGIFGYTEAPDGSAWFLGEDDYTYWNAGLKLAVEKWAFDFRYWDTSIDTGADTDGLASERFVFSASITLP